MSDDQPGGEPRLAPVALRDQTTFQSAFHKLAQPISDYSFANVYIWSSALKLYWTHLRRHVCLFANGTGDLTMLVPPLAERGATARDLRLCLGEAFEIMDAYNNANSEYSRSRIEYASDELLERINSVSGRSLRLSTGPMSGDYVYPVGNMIDLPGGALKSKRQLRTRFLREHPNHRVETLGDEHITDCLALLDLWQRRADADHDGQVTEDDCFLSTEVLRRRETSACRVALGDRVALGLSGLVVYCDGVLAGFTLGQSLSPAQASILIEKTHPDFNGCPQFIFSEFCRRCWADHPEINVGDDWGIPTLRWTKESYRPSRRLNKYVLTRPVLAPTLFSIPRERFAAVPPNEPSKHPESESVMTPVSASESVVREDASPSVGDPLRPESRVGWASGQPLMESGSVRTPDAPAEGRGRPLSESPANPLTNSPIVPPNSADSEAPPAVNPVGIPPPNPGQVVIRSARMDDLSELCALERLCFEPEIAFPRRLLRALIRNERAVFLIAEVNGLLAGCGVGLVRRGRRRLSGRIYDVAVNPAFRGRRLGTKLTQGVLEELCRRGTHRVYLEVRADNDAAVRLYRSLGFQFVRLLPDYYRSGVHGQSMRLTFPDPAEVPLFALGIEGPSASATEPTRR